ncbi:MAG: glycoside hydrolase family 16 protein [Eubacteriales bacterium]|nr:glycoside hydrolase family 16 protein [Eubacteriales bacterium]
MQKFSVRHHAESLLPDGHSWKLVWADEFDGTELDKSKWDYRLYLMQTRHNTFTTEGVELRGDSCVRLNLIEKDGQFYSPHLETGYNYLDKPPKNGKYGKFTWPMAEFEAHKFLHRYGYYECRCQLQRQPGWWSAFWLQSPVIGCCADPAVAGVEVDIMESFEPGVVIQPMLHWGGYGSDHQQDSPRADGDHVHFDEGFHNFGLLWEPDGYTFYYDGIQTGRKCSKAVSQIPQFLLISTECKGYRQSDCPDESLKKAVLPDAFVVDHVRVFDMTDEKE